MFSVRHKHSDWKQTFQGRAYAECPFFEPVQHRVGLNPVHSDPTEVILLG